MRAIRLLLLWTLTASGAAGTLAAEPELLTYRSADPFPEVMAQLQTAISDRGLVVSRVQRVDYGLNQRGFETAKYQVVFYGRADEIRHLAANHPELIPFLPLKITIYEDPDSGETALVALNPGALGKLYAGDELHAYFRRWETELRDILHAATRT